MAHRIVQIDGGTMLYRDDTYVTVENDLITGMYRHALVDVTGVVAMLGLGLATGVRMLIDKPEVTTIYVVELYQDLIDLINLQHPKLSYIQADARSFEWDGPDFDWVIADIWTDITHETLRESMDLTTKALNWARAGRSIPACYVEYVNGTIRTT